MYSGHWKQYVSYIMESPQVIHQDGTLKNDTDVVHYNFNSH